jgi:hypothetical protein
MGMKCRNMHNSLMEEMSTGNKEGNKILTFQPWLLSSVGNAHGSCIHRRRRPAYTTTPVVMASKLLNYDMHIWILWIKETILPNKYH